MKVLLATPPQPMSSIMPDRFKPMAGVLKLIGGNRPILGLQPPYGLLYLSSALRKAGHEVQVIDGLREEPGAVVDRIASWRPGIVGISSVTFNWGGAKELARRIRSLFPDIPLAVGGAHVNAVLGDALLDCPDFDFAFYGDAEESFPDLVNRLENGRPPVSRDGFAFRDGDRLVASDRGAVIADIDTIPLPDRDQLGLDAYRPSPQSYRRLPFAAVFGARGCPGHCTFCHTENRVRMRSAASIVDEIGRLVESYVVREILFYDDSFTVKRDRVMEICALLDQRRLQLSWAANARVDMLDPEMLAAMRRAGCWRLLIGIESGSQRILDRVGKNISLDQVRRAVDMIHAAGIQTYGMFILGFPTETYSEGLETIAFMKSLKLDFVNVSALTPFPGTEIFGEVRDEPGYRGFGAMNMYDVSYVPDTMTEAELSDLLRRSMREFYLRLPYVLGQARNIRTPTDLARYVRGAAIVALR